MSAVWGCINPDAGIQMQGNDAGAVNSAPTGIA
jgi:hypothetical protein